MVVGADGESTETRSLRLFLRMNEAPNPLLTPWLVIGYGNTLRSDDGVGPLAAEQLAALDLPGVEVLIYPLLAPEAADPVSRCTRVVFVDAAVGPARQVEFLPLAPAGSSQIMAHAANPQTILALARDVFGHCPEACLLTIPVADLSIGDTLSSLARAGMEAAVKLLQARCAEATR